MLNMLAEVQPRLKIICYHVGTKACPSNSPQYVAAKCQHKIHGLFIITKEPVNSAIGELALSAILGRWRTAVIRQAILQVEGRPRAKLGSL